MTRSPFSFVFHLINREDGATFLLTQLENAPKSKCVITSSLGVEVRSMSIFLRHVVKVDVRRASTVLQPFTHGKESIRSHQTFLRLGFSFRN